MLSPVLTVVAAPAPLISVPDAKAHLRVDFPDDDALIAALVAAATADLDGATGWLGRALGQQTLSLTAGHFPGCGAAWDWTFGFARWPLYHLQELRLPCPPVQSVTSVGYLDPTGAAQTLAASAYSLVDRTLIPVGGASWPATADRPDAVTITYVAGYAPGELPAPIRSAILLKVGTLYANRTDGAAIVNGAADALLAPWRVFA